MDRVLLRVPHTPLSLKSWEAVRLAQELLDAASAAQAEADSEEKPAAWSSSLLPASEIAAGDCVGGYEVASVEPDVGGRLTVILLTDRGSRMTTFFEPTDKVPLEKSP